MKILGWIIALPFILLALYVLLRFAFCRPNYFVVKTATPMVEKIADYIVEHGVPESLGNIPNMPLKVNNCRRLITNYKKIDFKDVKVQTKKESDKSIIDETCYFSENTNLYKIKLWLVEHNTTPKSIYGKLSIRLNKTHVGISFDTDENGKLIRKKIGSGFDNRFGFCRQFKQ